jgi:alpha-tubulin suppressor-like RCC1 family protein
VLGSEFGEDAKVIPTPQIIASDIKAAALGKAHTLFLKTDGTIHALGQNKVGQCAWRGNVKHSGVLKACIIPGTRKDDATGNFIKIACGEDFSVALNDQGVLYTTGSAEFGQTAAGETGEHFVKANKLAFNNLFGFHAQTVFVENDPNDSNSGDLSQKTTTIRSRIKIQDIAAGKHHALALEAPSGGDGVGTRIFSWGCGNYGVLGHNRQKDEYYPRHISSVQRGMTFTKLAAGSNCSLALTVQGHVYYWGNHRSNADAVMKPQLVDALANNQHIVTHIGAGPGNVVCTTDLGNTVVWGAGPYGELGLDGKKSSAKPAFVESISGLVVSDLSVGQGSVLYVIKDDKKLPKADLEAIEACLK